MKKIAWVFGKLSDFASTLISEFEIQGISTYGFGRGNTDYTNFDKFIDGKVVPDIVIINANVEEQIALVIDNKNFLNITLQEMSSMFFKYTPVFLFFTKLIKWLENSDKETTVCGISSSITAWPQQNKKFVMYAVLRSMMQQLVYSASSNVCNAFCVSPSGIDATNTIDYAKRVVQLTTDRTDLKLIDLTIGDEVANLQR
jgi:hypothetical protein